MYPLGTTVRLTTGEVGTVVHVNIRYPLRPVVRVNEHDEDGSGLRQVDLSLTPLVGSHHRSSQSSRGRPREFFKDHSDAHSPRQVGLASDHFTSLLESLDAIATAIQKVVEIRIAPHEGDARSEEAVDGVSGEPVEPNDLGFRKEIVGLFALEAREWLAQVQMALKKLGGGVEGPVRSRLYGFMLNGITNLAKSASTVGLVEIESMASNLLPILRDVGGAKMESIVEAVRPLQAGLDRIATAVHRLAGADLLAASAQPTQDSETEKGNFKRQGEEGPAISAIERPQVPEEVAATIPLLSALRELQRARARSMQPARDVLEAVIQHAEQESEDGNHHIDVKSIERILGISIVWMIIFYGKCTSGFRLRRQCWRNCERREPLTGWAGLNWIPLSPMSNRCRKLRGRSMPPLSRCSCKASNPFSRPLPIANCPGSLSD